MDQIIAPEAQSRETDNFESLARPCYARIYRFVVRQVNNATDAQDITQKIFISAYRSFSRFDARRPFDPWLFRIARCAVADHFRQPKIYNEELPERFADTAPGTIERVEQAECGDKLWALAGRLKPAFYQALYLHYAESFSLIEVAQIMRVTRPHAKVLLFRARLALKKLLETSEGKEITQ